MQTLWQDLRFGARMLLKNPGVTAIAVITLALAIGANTAIFSVVDAVALRPLSYKNPDRLVALWENVPQRGRWRVTPANYFDWKKQNHTFEDIAAFGASTLTLTGDGQPEQLQGTRVGSGYFNVVGVEPKLGRPFVSEEFEAGKNQVIILSEQFWKTRYGADPGIVNRAITLDGNSYTVVGVMPAGIYPGWPNVSAKISFESDQQQYWTPMTFTAQRASNRNSHVLGVLGRLKPGVTLAQSQADMYSLAARLSQEYAENKGAGIIVNPFMNEMVGPVKPALFTMLGAVGVVLLIACANIAGLLLAQHAARGKEVAIRAALGAGRGRLVRQFLIEGLLLSLLGTGAGVLLARFGVDFIVQLVPSQYPRFSQTQIDLRVLGFTAVLAVATCLLFTLFPAWQGSKPKLQTALEQGRRVSGVSAGRQRFRQLLVVFQISMAVMLVISAGLLVKTFWRLRQVDPGFEPTKVVSLTLGLPAAQYGDNQKINSFFNQLLDRLAAVPGVESASIAYDHPLQTNWIDAFAIVGRPERPDESGSANFSPVSWNYFETIGAKVSGGRSFTAQDDQDHPGVAIVNESFARKYFPNEKPLGQRLQLNAPGRIWENKRLTTFEIVGIARDVKSSGLTTDPEPTYYVPAAQSPLQNMTVLVRTTSEPAAIVPSLRSAVLAIDPNQPIANVKTMENIVADSIAQPRLSMLLMGLFGVLALVLAAVGIYGLLSYAVAQRTQEMGIRMALGARMVDVLTLVLKQGMTLVLLGQVFGLAAAFAFTRVLRTLLFGVTPTDLTTFVAVSTVLTAVAFVASYLPARRATKVDPLEALRYE
ncbi:MAG TPA: ABC transporter permease [Pyrinomonadaceae bacterium]|nr:ABC transporter permease [Pyrinomonadaceae bacterium]